MKIKDKKDILPRSLRVIIHEKKDIIGFHPNKFGKKNVPGKGQWAEAESSSKEPFYR
jgi:hypothetical protein